MLKLYFAPGASSMAVHIALHEIGVPFDSEVISLADRTRRPAEFLTYNPEGKVPTLLVDGRPMTEVLAILYYLAKRYPEADLLPVRDLESDAQALSWMSFVAATLHPARARGADYSHQVFAIADLRLGRNDWALGAYSIVDIHLFRLYWRFANAFKPPAGTFANLEPHFDRMMARPAVRRTIEIESEIGYELPA